MKNANLICFELFSITMQKSIMWGKKTKTKPRGPSSFFQPLAELFLFFKEISKFYHLDVVVFFAKCGEGNQTIDYGTRSSLVLNSKS